MANLKDLPIFSLHNDRDWCILYCPTELLFTSFQVFLSFFALRNVNVCFKNFLDFVFAIA
jgi:hypothetical protein